MIILEPWGGKREYFLKEIHINAIRDFIKKYYDKICLSIYDDAINFNRYFTKNNKIQNYYASKAWINYYLYKIKKN